MCDGEEEEVSSSLYWSGYGMLNSVSLNRTEIVRLVVITHA